MESVKKFLGFAAFVAVAVGCALVLVPVIKSIVDIMPAFKQLQGAEAEAIIMVAIMLAVYVFLAAVTVLGVVLGILYAIKSITGKDEKAVAHSAKMVDIFSAIGIIRFLGLLVLIMFAYLVNNQPEGLKEIFKDARMITILVLIALVVVGVALAKVFGKQENKVPGFVVLAVTLVLAIVVNFMLFENASGAMQSSDASTYNTLFNIGTIITMAGAAASVVYIGFAVFADAVKKD